MRVDRYVDGHTAALLAHVPEATIRQWVSRGYLQRHKHFDRYTRCYVNRYRERDVLLCEKARRDTGRQACQRLIQPSQ